MARFPGIPADDTANAPSPRFPGTPVSFVASPRGPRFGGIPIQSAPANDATPQSNGSAIGRIAGAAGSGFAEGWQPDVPLGLGPDAAEWFQNAGLLGHKGSLNPATAVTGPIIQGVATLGDLASRAFGGATAALGQGVGQAGKELGMERYSAERLARDVQGFGEVAGIVSGASPAARIPRPAEIARRPYPQPGSTPRAPAAAEMPSGADRGGGASKPVMDWTPVEQKAPPVVVDSAGVKYATKGEGLPQRGVAPANLSSDGSIYVGRPNSQHFEIADKHPQTNGWDRVGFVTPDGKFLNREEALSWVNANEGRVRPAENMDGRLDALDYREQVPETARSVGAPQISDSMPAQPITAAARAFKPIKQGPLEAIPDNLVEQAHYDVKQASAALPNEPSLFTRIRQLGGMRLHDNAGNLTKEGQDVTRVLTDVRQPGLISANGLRPDQVLSVLREEGYFGPRADRGVDLQELYDMLDSEARGQKVYHPDSGMAGALAARADLQREFSEAGILPHDSPASAAKKLADYRYQAMTADAEESAAIMAEGSGAPISGPRAGESNLKPNINLAGVPKDEAAILEETARRSGNFADARRGTMSHDATQQLADELGMTSEQLMKRRRGQAFNAEESLASRNLLAKATSDIKALRDKIRSGNGSDADRAAFMAALAEHGRIQEQVSAISAEAGRALQIHRVPLGGVAQGKAIKDALAQAGGGARVDELAEKLAALDDPAQLAAFVRNLKKPGKWDMVLEAWKSALLSGPVTHAVNGISNTINAFMPIAETGVAATLGAARNVLNVLPKERVYFREVGPQLFGLVQGTKDGLKIAAHTFTHELPKDLELATEIRNPQALPSLTVRKGAQKLRIGGVPIPFTGEMQLGGKQARVPLRALAAADDLYKEVARRQSINRLAMRQGLAEGLKGEALAARVHELRTTPTDEILEAANKTARYQTFTNDLGPSGKEFQNFLRRYPGWQVVFPFVRTPVNIVKYAAERTPAALLMRDMRADLMGRNGTIAADTARAKVLLGSSFAATIAYFANQGLITGQGPPSPEERAALFATGWAPYSVKVGNEYVSYQRMAPLGIIMGATADMVEAGKVLNERQADDIATLITGSITKNITNQTFLRGASDLIGALENPDYEGQRWMQNLAGSLVPTGVAQYANTQDPYLREVSGMLDAIKRRIPGQSQSLPAVLDFFGEPIKREGAVGPDMLSPFYKSSVKDNPAAQEIVRLGIKPTKVDRALDGVRLTPQQYSEYQAGAGHLAKSLISLVIQSPGYARAPDGVKAEMIEKVFTNAKQAARNQIRARYPELVRDAAAGKVNSLLGPRLPTPGAPPLLSRLQAPSRPPAYETDARARTRVPGMEAECCAEGLGRRLRFPWSVQGGRAAGPSERPLAGHVQEAEPPDIQRGVHLREGASRLGRDMERGNLCSCEGRCSGC
jgi:hypothetical protein